MKSPSTAKKTRKKEEHTNIKNMKKNIMASYNNHHKNKQYIFVSESTLRRCTAEVNRTSKNSQHSPYRRLTLLVESLLNMKCVAI